MILSKQHLITSELLRQQFWALMEKSFPKNETRTYEDFVSVLKNKDFAVVILSTQQSKIKGFITYWQLQMFHFVEHFAIAPHLRGQGIGSALLSTFIAENNRPVVLEVEPPTTAISIKRVKFYERLGFTLTNFAYQQPAYRCNEKAVDLLLMSNQPELINNKNGFRQVKTEIHQTVYKHQR
ncbi:GNAT family N-acetyltransferase [Geofilum sp. OHC36d9]|uniref:GNAT family N-acetyltransferase n=1 Tax=Geofilum sp. OHC36d9 TaxID=3458413 RepID=UPI00403434A4